MSFMCVMHAAASEPLRICVLGTSLSAGYGLDQGRGYVERLGALLRAKGYGVTMDNEGVSGDTSAGGLARLDWALAGKPDIMIIELGGNDALRGLAPAETERNLSAILSRLTKAHIPVLFMGMMAPPNLGPDYGAEFNAVYPALAKKYGVAFYPFVLDGVAAKPALNQADGIHPNAEGAELMAEKILPYLVPLIETAEKHHDSSDAK
jgi:acyl-CoA thioesterase-1